MKPKTAGRTSGNIPPTGRSAQPNMSGVGLVSGARILTLRGEQPVETLRAGDRVIARGGGAIPLTGIDVVSMVTHVVYIIAGSIGHSRPDSDTLLTAEQPVLIRDWRAMALYGAPHALVPARRLIDGEFVRNLGQQAVTLYRLHCAAPQVVFADGLELGTANSFAEEMPQRAA